MVKYWVDYITNSESKTKAGYRSLEGFVTDILDWAKSEHEDSEEQLYIYEEHNKEAGFYITLEDIGQ